jgi:hypothetical protein
MYIFFLFLGGGDVHWWSSMCPYRKKIHNPCCYQSPFSLDVSCEMVGNNEQALDRYKPRLDRVLYSFSLAGLEK